MKRPMAILCLSVIPAWTSTALALPPRCMGYPNAEHALAWCDDFDNYCTEVTQPWTGGPPYPPRCPADGPAHCDNAKLLANWPANGRGANTCQDPNGFPSVGPCSGNAHLGTDSALAFNLPFYLVYPGGPFMMTTRHAYDITSRLQTYCGHNTINGTDATHLVLKVLYNFTADSRGPNAHHYTELVLDNGEGSRAPTNYVWLDCSAIGASQGPYPVICQQDRTERTDGGTSPTFTGSVDSICPPLTETIYPSLAFGPNALLDPNPCNIGPDGGRKPTEYHLAVFDGKKWYALPSGIFGATGDFVLYWNWNTVQMTVSTDTFDVELTNTVTGHENQARHSEATNIPRQYLGPFNKVANGMGGACQVNPGTGSCVTAYGCFNYNQSEDEAWYDTSIDSPVLLDGACCPLPFADADGDEDVDQADFAAFQRCFTGHGGVVLADCSCFDRDGDNDVDAADLAAFDNCWTGPNVPYSVALPPSCNP